jgi:hypothetical protein
MTAVRADVAELLRAGYSDRAITRQLGIRNVRVAGMRRALGYPPHKPGPAAAATVEDKFWRRAVPTDDGHLLWSGKEAGRPPRLKYDGVNVAVHVVAFGIANDREPEGCVHPRHVEDDVLRARFAAVFGEIFGTVTV